MPVLYAILPIIYAKRRLRNAAKRFAVNRSKMQQNCGIMQQSVAK